MYSCVCVCVCAHVCTHMCAYQGAHVEIRGQLKGICSFFPPCGAWISNSSPQAWQQTLLPTEPSH